MKHLKILVLAIALIATTSFVNAQSKVAHINTQELVQAMPEMKIAQAELEKMAKTYQADMKAMGTELQNKVKQYQAEAASQTPEENAKREQEVIGMEQTVRQFQGNAQQKLAEKEAQLLEPIYKKAKDAIVRVSKAQGFQYVLDSTAGQGVIVAEGTDLMASVKQDLGF